MPAMSGIAKTHGGDAAGRPWLEADDGPMARLEALLAQLGVVASEAVVLLPFPALLAEARRAWSRRRPSGFAPRFETCAGWARSLAPPDDATAGCVVGDTACDLLQARALLDQVPVLRRHAETLAGPLADAACQLHRAMAAVPPAEREVWGAAAVEAIGAGTDAAVLQLEAATARVALAWALASSCATDVLFTDAARASGVRCLVVGEGLEADPLAEALARHWESAGLPVGRIALRTPAATGGTPPARLQSVADAEDEAERAAACVLAHAEAGRRPVALVANDRALTRRIGAMLRARGLVLRDESGWKLSTTRAAALVASALRACPRTASADDVLDWLKPAAETFGAARVQALEAALRRDGVRDWSGWRAPREGTADPAGLRGLADDIATLREAMQRARPLPEWLAGLRALLQAGGAWDSLAEDPAGKRVIAVLRLEPAAQEAFAQQLEASPWAARRLGLAAFTQWARQVLEAANFTPEMDGPTADADVVVVPLPQLLARRFGAVVLPGCDELRLPASPEPAGNWSGAQRVALGLPTREALQAATAAAWDEALRGPQVDVLWRAGDEGGEPLLPSPLVQALQARPGAVCAADDPRALRQVAVQPVRPPQPRGDGLPVDQLSASAYEDLRKCPYRFFALRQLGLREADELDAEIDKRDFGLWLHDVLRTFHEALAEAPTDDAAERRDRLDAAAATASHLRGLAQEDFLPFAATWPATRDGYLAWLAGHEAGGARFAWAEAWREQPLGRMTLIGQIDRMDTVPAGAGAAPQPLVIDYKTEGLQTTRDRLRRRGEDTQLAFYAALLEDDALQAAYLNIGEKGLTTDVPQEDVVEARDALVEGILGDFARIGAGDVLPALGEGPVCDWCAARGLCRKDWWSVP